MQSFSLTKGHPTISSSLNFQTNDELTHGPLSVPYNRDRTTKLKIKEEVKVSLMLLFQHFTFL